MKRVLRNLMQQCVDYRIGILAGVFLITAGWTCGTMHGKDIAASGTIPEVWSVLKGIQLSIGEFAFCAALLVASMHPFGCALCAGLLSVRAYRCGLAQTMMRLNVQCVMLLVVLIIHLLLSLYGCNITAYAALQTGPLNRREIPKKLITLLILLQITALLRYAALYWIS